MRDFTGIAYQALPEPTSADFNPRLKGILANLDYFLRDFGAATRNLDKGLTTTGQVPPTTVDLSKFMFLPGRSGGQTLLMLNSSDVMFTIAGTTPMTGKMFQTTVNGTPVLESYYNTTLTRSEVKIGGDGAFPIYMHSDGLQGYFYCDKITFNAPLASVNYPKSQYFGVQSSQIQLLGRVTTRATVSNIGLEMNMSNVPDLSDASVGMMVSQHSATQSGDLFQFTNANATTVLSRVKSDGTWSGPLDSTVSYTFDDSLFSIFNHASNTKKIALSAASITAGNTRTLTVPDASGTIACKDVAQTFTADQKFDNSVSGLNPTILTANSGGDAFMIVADAAAPGTNSLTISYNGVLSGNTILNFPTSGSVVSTTASASLTSKSITSITNINLTSQSADKTTTNLTLGITQSSIYQVSAYLECVATDAGASPIKLTLGWTDDNGAQSVDVITNVVLTATGFKNVTYPVFRASGNISYAVTGGGTYGTARWTLRLRALAMGA